MQTSVTLRRLGSRLAAVAILSAAAITLPASPAAAQSVGLPQSSPKARVEQQVGVTDFAVDYSSPGVKGREIFGKGKLVPYGEVWRTGANSATNLTVSRDFTFGGTKVPAGTYSLFTIPGESKWTVVLNSNPKTWGTNGYDAKQDVARIDVQAQKLDTPRERLAFVFSNTTDNSTRLDIEWEKVRVSVPVTVDTAAHVAANIDTATDSAWRPHFESARWLLENNGDLKRALSFVDTSIAVKPTWWNHWVKAEILAKSGKSGAAVKSANEAKKLGKGDYVYDNFYKTQIDAKLATWKK
jgi:Protein of unknown function (DUF2911)